MKKIWPLVKQAVLHLFLAVLVEFLICLESYLLQWSLGYFPIQPHSIALIEKASIYIEKASVTVLLISFTIYSVKITIYEIKEFLKEL